MSAEEQRIVSNLLKFSEGLWAELKDAGFCDTNAREPWQFIKARAAIAKAKGTP